MKFIFNIFDYLDNPKRGLFGYLFTLAALGIISLFFIINLVHLLVLYGKLLVIPIIMLSALWLIYIGLDGTTEDNKENNETIQPNETTKD